MAQQKRPVGNRTKGSSMAEFAGALVLVIIFLFFTISVLSFCCGYGALVYACQLGAREAGSSPNLKTAREQVIRIKKTIVEGGFGKFGGVEGPLPPGSAGLTLDVFQLVDGQNQPLPWLPGNAIVTARGYQYRVRASYKIQPLFWPAFPTTTESTSVVERPEGLAIVN